MNEPFAPVTMPKVMDHLRITEIASQQAVLRRYLDSHRDWIEHHLGCRMEEALLLEFDISFAQLAVEGSLRGSSEIPERDSRMVQLQKQVVAVEFPSYLIRSLEVEELRDPRSHFAQPKKLLQLKSKEILTVLRF